MLDIRKKKIFLRNLFSRKLMWPSQKSLYLNWTCENFRMFYVDYMNDILINQDYLLKIDNILLESQVFFIKYLKFYRKRCKFTSVNINLLLPKLITFYNFSKFKRVFGKSQIFKKVLLLNYKRGKFFPSIQNHKNHIYTTFSLGMFSKFFKKGKAFIKNKANFLVSAGFLRKILTYAEIRHIILLVKRTPLYFPEILSSINSPVIANYKHPFSGVKVDEMKSPVRFFYHYFIFFNTKAYGFMKGPKKGRIKRKITKRIVKINRLTD